MTTWPKIDRVTTDDNEVVTLMDMRDKYPFKLLQVAAVRFPDGKWAARVRFDIPVHSSGTWTVNGGACFESREAALAEGFADVARYVSQSKPDTMTYAQRQYRDRILYRCNYEMLPSQQRGYEPFKDEQVQIAPPVQMSLF